MEKTCWIHLWFKVSPCFNSFSQYDILCWGYILGTESIGEEVHRELSVARRFLLAFYKKSSEAGEAARQTRSEFWWRTSGLCFVLEKVDDDWKYIGVCCFNHVLIKIQHCQMQCDVEMYWICLRCMCVQNPLVCLSGAIHAGMKSKSFCRTAALGISAHFETAMWFAAQTLIDQNMKR